MTELVSDHASTATINPGQLQIVRELNERQRLNFDTAVFSGNRAELQHHRRRRAIHPTTSATISSRYRDCCGPRRHRPAHQHRAAAVRRSVVDLCPGSTMARWACWQSSTPKRAIPTIRRLRPSAEGDGCRCDRRGQSRHWRNHRADHVSLAGRNGPLRASSRTSARWLATVSPDADGPTFTVTADLVGLATCASRRIYQDANGVLETGVLCPTTGRCRRATRPAPWPAVADGIRDLQRGVRFIRADLEFILDQIEIAERHAAGEDSCPIAELAGRFGLRTSTASLTTWSTLASNLVQRSEPTSVPPTRSFPRLVDPVFEQSLAGGHARTHRPAGFVVDCAAAHHLQPDRRPDDQQSRGVCQRLTMPARTVLTLASPVRRRRPEGRRAASSPARAWMASSAPPTTRQSSSSPTWRRTPGCRRRFNSWFTFFGQFFDHGLDLVTRAATARSSFRCSRTIRSLPARWHRDSRRCRQSSWC